MRHDITLEFRFDFIKGLFIGKNIPKIHATKLSINGHCIPRDGNISLTRMVNPSETKSNYNLNSFFLKIT